MLRIVAFKNELDLKSTIHETKLGTAAFEFDILMMAGLCKPCWSHWLGGQQLISCFCGVRQLRFTRPSPKAGCQSITEAFSHPSL